ncbi:hypothetical protein CKN73_03005 [Carnobacterium divergens]|nr:hypothetical protein CKN77_02935 [Carnobacterium divergens]TFJ51454.1 hypothetical protein CKN73_03005 [Carnobacterium divergens]TFJ56444.1 hypothetical protein CKN83_02950 [Carnobacterium divergens]TFJ64084.1 hypothetical protein CKN89_03030 [Carnobacterium divergens]TFJ73403.1 hypothetical protein CKN91_02950 [Carnobacterium divergens]
MLIIVLICGYFIKASNNIKTKFKEEVTTEKVAKDQDTIISSFPTKLIFIKEGFGLPIIHTKVDSDGRMSVPKGLGKAGWLQTSPIPGNIGNSLIAAHRDWNNQLGPFKYLENIKIGETVVIEYEDGTNREFKVVKREVIDTTTNPDAKIEINSNKRMITLISCTGAFDTKIKSYTQRALVTLE